MSNYKNIISQHKPNNLNDLDLGGAILKILKDLQDNQCANITPEIQDSISDLLINPKLSQEDKDDLKTIIIQYAEHYGKLLFDKTPQQPEQQNITPKIEDGCELRPSEQLHLRPEDCKPKEYDIEFLKLLDCEDPDGWGTEE